MLLFQTAPKLSSRTRSFALLYKSTWLAQWLQLLLHKTFAVDGPASRNRLNFFLSLPLFGKRSGVRRVVRRGQSPLTFCMNWSIIAVSIDVSYSQVSGVPPLNHFIPPLLALGLLPCRERLWGISSKRRYIGKPTKLYISSAYILYVP